MGDGWERHAELNPPPSLLPPPQAVCLQQPSMDFTSEKSPFMALSDESPLVMWLHHDNGPGHQLHFHEVTN